MDHTQVTENQIQRARDYLRSLLDGVNNANSAAENAAVVLHNVAMDPEKFRRVARELGGE